MTVSALDVGRACLCFHAQRAARAVARRYDRALRPTGLTNGQFSILMSLSRPDAPTMLEAAHPLGMDRTTLTAALKPIERRGLVRQFAEPRDGRVRRVAITEAGRALLARALPLWEVAQAETADRLPAGADLDRLRAELRAMA
jgi:DNA-binding MarR family transcriptional regulator